jgi:hypothetical protein
MNVFQVLFGWIRGAMTIEYDEKVKIFTEVVSKVPVLATIQTTTHLIHGRVHVRRDQRIKDELDVNENFLAMTDVSVLGPDGQTLFQAPFMAVRRSHIVWVIPEQEKNEERTFGVTPLIRCWFYIMLNYVCQCIYIIVLLYCCISCHISIAIREKIECY